MYCILEEKKCFFIYPKIHKHTILNEFLKFVINILILIIFRNDQTSKQIKKDIISVETKKKNVESFVGG